MTKSFGADELMARCAGRSASWHRGCGRPDAGLPCDAFGLDFTAMSARLTGGDEEVHLILTEWRIFTTLARQPGRLVPHETLLKAVWGPGYGRECNYLRVFANQIRRKLEPEPGRPRHLITEPGLGYRLDP